jgi:hypothetical protein
VKKTRTLREARVRYTPSAQRPVENLAERLALRNATPAQIKLLQRDIALYEKYAKQLEREHTGEYVAIGLDGTLVIGGKHVLVLAQAAEKFGAGNFALWKIGYNYELKWRRV